MGGFCFRISSLIAPANNVVTFPTTSRFLKQKVSSQKVFYPNVYDCQQEAKLNAGILIFS